MTDVIDLVDLAQTLPQLIIDMKYATADNLTGHPIYAEALCLLHPYAARGLALSVAVAEQSGYRLQLYDAYRPHAAQIRLWDACPDPRFVASLAVGSHHSRGVAVDVTLLDEQSKALDMGTGFDEMNEKSYAWCAALPVAVQRNRLQPYAVQRVASLGLKRNGGILNCRMLTVTRCCPIGLVAPCPTIGRLFD